jgi:hypothetical protein
MVGKRGNDKQVTKHIQTSVLLVSFIKLRVEKHASFKHVLHYGKTQRLKLLKPKL